MEENENNIDPNYGSAHSKCNTEEDHSLISNSDNLHRKFAHCFSGRYFYALLTGFQTVDAVQYYGRIFPYYLSQNISTVDEATLDSSKLELCHKELLFGTFEYLENTYEQNLSEQLTEKALLNLELQEKNAEEYPQINDRLKELTKSLSSGLSAVLALIYKQKIYVASTGDTRAFLAREVFDSLGNIQLKAVSLTSVHSVNNLQELDQLLQSKIDIKTVRANGRIGNMSLTRCLGNFYMKKFYKEFPEFEKANTDLRIKWEPSLEDFSLDKSCHFLILSSASVIYLVDSILEKTNKTLTSNDNALTTSDAQNINDNKPSRTASIMLIEIVNKHFLTESSMSSVAQKSLQEIIQLFRSNCGNDMKISELSLIVRDLRPEFGFVRSESISQNFQQLTIDINAPQIERNSDIVDSANFDKNSPDSNQNISVHQELDTFPIEAIDLTSNEEIDAYVDFKTLLNGFGEA